MPVKTKRCFALFILACLVFAGGCARVPKHTPIQPISTLPSQISGFYHTLSKGETLYHVAKVYNVDLSELMRVNRIANPSSLEIGQRLWVPGPVLSVAAPYAPMNVDAIKKRVGPKSYFYEWKTITLHHSATLQGSAKQFNRYHTMKHMGGLFYHFVVGNGTHSGDGEVEVGWRWDRQVKANRPNDIQICMVGDFNRQEFSAAQFNSLVTLIRILQQEYNIPTSAIRRHEDIKGKHTECPGKNFPFRRILRVLNEYSGQPV